VTDPPSPGHLRLARLSILAALCLSLTFTALTVNRERLQDVQTNRFWRVCQIWNERGFFRTFGLWLEFRDPGYYSTTGPKALYAYRGSSTGFLVPLYVVERLIQAVRGRPSVVVFQLYSQVVVLAGAYILALIGLRVALRRGATLAFAWTCALGAALVFQNFIHNLDRAREIHHSTVSIVLMLAVLLLGDRSPDRPRWAPALTAALVFAMALSDHITNTAFFVLALGLLSFYGVGPVIPRQEWTLAYVAPALLGALVFQAQLWLGRAVLGVSSIGSPLLFRMGLTNSQYDSHRLIFTFLRPPWSWGGFAALAAVGLVVVLAAHRDPKADSRDLPPVLAPLLVHLLLFTFFPNLVVIHPYVFDVFLIVPSVLVVLVYVPVIAMQRYRRPGVVALAVLMFSLLYVSISLVDYSRIAAG